MQVERICNKCGEVNTIDSGNLIRQDVYDEFGTYYKVMYYQCKRCRELIPVQIDDKETLELFRKMKKLSIKVIRMKQKGQTVSPKDIRKKDRWTKELKEKRHTLNERMNGIKLLDENNKILFEKFHINVDSL